MVRHRPPGAVGGIANQTQDRGGGGGGHRRSNREVRACEVEVGHGKEDKRLEAMCQRRQREDSGKRHHSVEEGNGRVGASSRRKGGKIMESEAKARRCVARGVGCCRTRVAWTNGGKNCKRLQKLEAGSAAASSEPQLPSTKVSMFLSLLSRGLKSVERIQALAGVRFGKEKTARSICISKS
eukprot:4011303-Amphidinium_carterae.3